MAPPKIMLKFDPTTLGMFTLLSQVRVLGTIRYETTCNLTEPTIELGLLIDHKPNRVLISGDQAWIVGSFNEHDANAIRYARAGQEIELSCGGCTGIRLGLIEVKQIVKKTYYLQPNLVFKRHRFRHWHEDDEAFTNSDEENFPEEGDFPYTD